MTTEELLQKISDIKELIQEETDKDDIARYKAKLSKLENELAETQKKVEVKEDKLQAEEDEKVKQLEQKIKDLKELVAEETDAEDKARFKAKLDKLIASLGEQKQEIKEEKKEIAEQKAEIKEAVKEVKAATKKSVRKVAIKKAAAQGEERGQVTKKKTARKKKLQSILTDLDRLIENNEILKAKYKGKGVDLKKDAGRAAKPFGYRFVGKYDYRVPTPAQVKAGKKRGTIDYEGRPNRSDKYPTGVNKAIPKSKGAARHLAPQLADGGMMDGGMMAKGGLAKGKLKIIEDRLGYTVYRGGKALESFWSEEQAKKFVKQIEQGKLHYADGGMTGKGMVSEWELKPNGRYYAEFFINKRDPKYREIAEHGVTESIEEVDGGIKMIISVTKEGKKYFEDNFVDSDYMAHGGMMADGGMMAHGGMMDSLTENGRKVFNQMKKKKVDRYYVSYRTVGQYADDMKIKLSEKEMNDVADLYVSTVMSDGGMMNYGGMMSDGGMMAHGGKTQGYDDREDERLAMKHGKIGSKDLDSTHARRDDARFEERMAKGGKVKDYNKDKKEDGERFAKPRGYRWKDSAVGRVKKVDAKGVKTDKKVTEADLAKTPSDANIDKYKGSKIAFENRLSKSDKRPSRKYLSL